MVSGLWFIERFDIAFTWNYYFIIIIFNKLTYEYVFKHKCFTRILQKEIFYAMTEAMVCSVCNVIPFDPLTTRISMLITKHAIWALSNTPFSCMYAFILCVCIYVGMCARACVILFVC